MPHFCIVNGKEAVLNICNLIKRFTFASHLKQIFAIDKEITLLGRFYVMINL